MFKFIFNVTLAILLTCPSFSYALSDKDYLEFKKTSQEFALADKVLNETWKSLNATLKQLNDLENIKELKNYHTNWIKTQRDEIAKNYQSKLGMSPVESYTKATNEWAQALNFYDISLTSIKEPAIYLHGNLDESSDEVGVCMVLVSDTGFEYRVGAPWDFPDEDWENLEELLSKGEPVSLGCTLRGLFWVDTEKAIMAQ